jgi:arginase
MQHDIINACTDLGLQVTGTEKGPVLLYNEIKDIKSIDNVYTVIKDNIEKCTDNNVKLKNLDSVNIFNKELYNVVSKSIKNDHFPIIIGGDHSITIASALASINYYQNLGIIWIDSHGDFNTEETTISGNIHGLPFATVTGYFNKMLIDFHKGPFYNFKNAVLVGARSLDELEKLNLIKCGITVFTTNDIKDMGAKEVMKKAWAIANNSTKGVHISYDIDVIDPNIAPGVSVPELDGINVDDTKVIMEFLVKNKNDIKSIDFVEFNPIHDVKKETLNLASTLLESFLENKK